MTLLDEYLSVKEMVAVEKNSEYLGISTQQLMENAGKSVADEVVKRFTKKHKITVIGGLSGNGGDSYVTARHLAARGFLVEVIILGDPDNIRLENTKANWKALSNMKSSIKITKIMDSSQIEPIKSDVIIDGLIGISMKGPLKSPFKQLVQVINESKAYRISIDIPTGMEADTGKVLGESVDPDLTITFHKPKQGFSYNSSQIGELKVANIGIPLESELFTGPGDVFLVNKKRGKYDHKGMSGSLLVIGGNENYSGAPSLTAMGAYAVGLDLVYVAVPDSCALAVASFSPSIITVELDGNKLDTNNLNQIEPFLNKVDAVALGPGLGLDKDTIKAVNKLIKMVQANALPFVLDADGLKAYKKKKNVLTTPTIFTPHSREFRDLFMKDLVEDFRKRGAIVEKEAGKIGGVILLKGSVDVISNGLKTRYNWSGNPGMTVGGTGDVLCGVTAALLAQGANSFNAASAGAFINGSAGDLVYEEKGYHLQPEDLIKKIPIVMERSLHARNIISNSFKIIKN